MKQKIKSIVFGIPVGIAIALSVGFQSDFFEIAKQIDIYTTLFKELNIYYVDEINPAELTKQAINNTLENLDPYTQYYDEQGVEDARITSSGEYGGIGALTRFKDNKLTIREILKDSPAEKAAIKNDIMELPRQFETLVGERGVTLSGGQKQRLSIARALIKNPDIIVLDECLSALDANTEYKILKYLEESLSDKSSIIITHRISKLIEFDKIIVLEHGELVEEGTHETLQALDGFYKQILKNQYETGPG